MDKKRSARAAASRYRSLVTAAGSINRNPGRHSRSRSTHLDSPLPRYDPENEAAQALEQALRHKDLTYHSMFRYAKAGDIALMILGVTCAILWGILEAVAISAVGKWVEIVIDDQFCSNHPNRSLPAANQSISLLSPSTRTTIRFYAFALCVLILVFSALATYCFALSSHNQTFRIRLCYFESVLRKDMAWLDNYVQREFGRHMTHDVTILRNGLGGHISYLIYDLVTVPALLSVSFSIDWVLTLLTLTFFLPFMIGSGRLSIHFGRRELEVEDELDDKSEAYAEQVLSNIKAVKLYGTQEYELERYKFVVKDAGKLWEYMVYTGICISGLWVFHFFASTLAQYFGRQVVAEYYLLHGCHFHTDRGFPFPIHPDRATGGAVFVIFLSVFLVTVHSFEVVSIISMILETKKVAAEVFFMIDWKPRIDNMSNNGECPGAKAVGKIEFQNVSFKYPRKMEIMALKHVNLTIGLGQLVAILGDCGSGKSTILRLIHRLYDPTHGYIFFDGRRVESLNVGWLRSQIAHVPQKPVLFNKTVEENVRFGNSSATQPQVEEACKIAGIHDEILILRQGYKTIVGHRGKLLTLGQRRRIAFARAYLQRPKVLLLDEPVNESGKDYEEAILTTINQLRQNTTVVITSSDINSIVRQCDRIYVMDQGYILQEGTHASLIESDGLYAMMENGIHAGIPAEHKLRLTSQLKSYNFAKTLRKWKQDNSRGTKRRGEELRPTSDFNSPFTARHDDEEDNFYQYQRRTRATNLIMGTFNTYNFARRNVAAYDLRTGDRGVRKANNIGGLAILKRKITKIKQQKTGSRVVGQSTPTSIRNSDQVSLHSRTRSVNVPEGYEFPSEDNKSVMEDTPSTQSVTERNEQFWDEYETILENLDDDKTMKRSWANLFSAGFRSWKYFLLVIASSSSVGFLAMFPYYIFGRFYEELTHIQLIMDSGNLSPSMVLLLIFGVVAGIVAFSQNVAFTFGGYKLTSTLKVKLLKALMAKDMEWFDLPENDISIICHRLTIDTAAIENVRLEFSKSYPISKSVSVQGLLIILGVVSETLFGIVSALSIVMYYALFGPASFLPYAMVGIPLSIVLFVCVYYDGMYQLTWNRRLDGILVRVSEMEVDVVVNIRTVITLGLEEHFLSQMTEELRAVDSKIFWRNTGRNFLGGLSHAMPYLIYTTMALITLATIDEHGIRETRSTWHLLLLTELLVQFMTRAGIGLATVPNTESAREAATRIRAVFSSKLTEVSETNTISRSFDGPVSLTVKHLTFSSLQNPIPQNPISFEVKPGGYLGIVGIGSDSGSSMLINLLARFYKPTSGTILLNGVNIWSLDIDTFRNHTGFVEESPNIFDISIKDNIIYGLDSNTVTIEEIIQVATDTKIHEAIIKLPQGYDTLASTIRLDDRSCGLLQRLVLARALIRNPNLLFVDGHTTSINEQENGLLQEALKFCRQNRTIVVASDRISTVQTADHIIVLQDGSIVEEGTHPELIALKRLYYQMFMYQQTITHVTPQDDLGSTSDELQLKSRSQLAYERFLQKRMFPLVPRAQHGRF